eukprot:TRINITY_DN11602_c0_g1_i1.p1 TRINITY_DN11602_c0_g1~~TRINITY_DN11602_c0_g1_i1.p1  ORF type:complete len:262 (+),score=59.94 TRINITY_DN11602_c0_g1_i1:92-877(+)
MAGRRVYQALGIGSAAGFAGSLIGLGGGFVAIPMMTGMLKMTQHQAHGTSLAAVSMTGAAGSASLAMHGCVDWQAALAISLGGMFTAPLGARAAALMSPSHLRLAFGGLQISMGCLIFFKKEIDAWRQTLRQGASSAVPPEAKMAAAGCISGFFAGLMGVGGGMIIVPAVQYALDSSHHTALGTSLASMVIPALSGSMTHYRHGNLLLAVAVPLGAGTALGSCVGGQVAPHVDEEYLRWLFSAFAFGLGGKGLWKHFAKGA